MAWQTTAPTLPEGSSYGKKYTGAKSGSNYDYSVYAQIARLAGNNVSLKCYIKFTMAYGNRWVKPGGTYFYCKGDTYRDSSDTINDPGDHVTRYWVGEALPGTELSVKIGASGASGYYIKLSKIKVPGTIITDIPVFMNDGGTIHKTRGAFANIAGVIEECKVFVNVGGEIIEIK